MLKFGGGKSPNGAGRAKEEIEMIFIFFLLANSFVPFRRKGWELFHPTVQKSSGSKGHNRGSARLQQPREL